MEWLILNKLVVWLRKIIIFSYPSYQNCQIAGCLIANTNSTPNITTNISTNTNTSFEIQPAPPTGYEWQLSDCEHRCWL